MCIDDPSPYGDSPRIVAVGWLAVGAHQCDLCVFAAERSGTEKVIIPGEGRVYVAPELGPRLACLRLHQVMGGRAAEASPVLLRASAADCRYR